MLELVLFCCANEMYWETAELTLNPILSSISFLTHLLYAQIRITLTATSTVTMIMSISAEIALVFEPAVNSMFWEA